MTGLIKSQKDNTSLFPEDISDLKPDEFYCRYNEQLPLGDGIQIYLEVTYPNAETYTAEKE